MNDIASPGSGAADSRSRPRPFSGVLVPALTPFRADLEPDVPAFVAFCRRLLDEGANGLAVFGTTSEANSLSTAERRRLLAAAIEGGVPPATLMPGTGMCNIPEAVELTRDAVSAGAGGALVLPPFYYKNVPEDGVYAYYAELIERVGDARLRLYLYHFPQMSGVPITSGVIARLCARYGATVTGLKDSSGDWDNVSRLLREFPHLDIFPSSERLLLRARELGAAGCISATANYQAGRIRRLLDASTAEEREQVNARLGACRAVFERYPLVPALKFAIAGRLNQAAWRTVRPPLSPLPDDLGRQLVEALAPLDQADA